MSADHPLVASLLTRCCFPPAGSSVECAVSGGADSTTLLVLAVAAGLSVTAVHVDHGLRPGSEGEAETVAANAGLLGAWFEARRVDVTDGPNLEARARAARYSVLSPGVLTGHTLDDQAETVLLFLMRGTGPEGLSGMDRTNRPLLGLRRSETVALCAALELRVVDDPTNDDPRFTRNRVRQELLPLMDDIARRDVAPLIARAADLQLGVSSALDAATDGVDPSDARAVGALPDVLAAHVLRRWWRSSTNGAYAPDAAAVARMIDVARGAATSTDVVDGWRLQRSSQRLSLWPPPTG